MNLTAETIIRTDRDTVWQMSQNPAHHIRWDLRFTDIEYLPKLRPEDPHRLRYGTRLGFGLAIEGWGESVGHSGKQASALRFGSDDPKSLIHNGTGSWTYKDVPGGVRFSTTYDYDVRYGVLGWLVDRLLFRSLMIWATRWSFDRLRIWLESGTPPEVLFRLWLSKVLARGALGIVWVHEGLLPKILFVQRSEVALVERLDLPWISPEATITALGITEVLVGVWLVEGRAERLSAAVTSVAVVAFTVIARSLEPAALYDTFGGIAKNLALLGCGAVVWVLSPLAPSASRKVES